MRNSYVSFRNRHRRLGVAQSTVKVLSGWQSREVNQGGSNYKLTLWAVVRIQFLMDTWLEATPGLCHVIPPIWQIQYGSWLLSKNARGFEEEKWLPFYSLSSEELLTHKRDISGANSSINVPSLIFG